MLIFRDSEWYPAAKEPRLFFSTAFFLRFPQGPQAHRFLYLMYKVKLSSKHFEETFLNINVWVKSARIVILGFSKLLFSLWACSSCPHGLKSLQGSSFNLSSSTSKSHSLKKALQLGSLGIAQQANDILWYQPQRRLETQQLLSPEDLYAFQAAISMVTGCFLHPPGEALKAETFWDNATVTGKQGLPCAVRTAT